MTPERLAEIRQAVETYREQGADDPFVVHHGDEASELLELVDQLHLQVDRATHAVYEMWGNRYAAEVPEPVQYKGEEWAQPGFVDFPGPIIVDLGQLAVAKGCVDQIRHNLNLPRAR